MASMVKAEAGIEKVLNELVDLFGTTDTLRIIITTDASASADAVLTDVTQISNANGYTTDGEDSQNDSTRTGGTVTLTAVDIVWTATGGNLGNSTTGRYFWCFDDTATANDLLFYHDYGATFTVATGETMTWNTGASLLTAA